MNEQNTKNKELKVTKTKINSKLILKGQTKSSTNT